MLLSCSRGSRDLTDRDEPTQNGTMTTASQSFNKDLFFALKGGLNRFGIVTSAVFVTHKQPKVYVSQHSP
jgi:hypothetical protein